MSKPPVNALPGSASLSLAHQGAWPVNEHRLWGNSSPPDTDSGRAAPHKPQVLEVPGTRQGQAEPRHRPALLRGGSDNPQPSTLEREDKPAEARAGIARVWRRQLTGECGVLPGREQRGAEGVGLCTGITCGAARWMISAVSPCERGFPWSTRPSRGIFSSLEATSRVFSLLEPSQHRLSCW